MIIKQEIPVRTDFGFEIAVVEIDLSAKKLISCDTSNIKMVQVPASCKDGSLIGGDNWEWIDYNEQAIIDRALLQHKQKVIVETKDRIARSTYEMLECDCDDANPGKCSSGCGGCR